MGASISHINNRLSFDYANYLRERLELSTLLRKISELSVSYRSNKRKLQIVNGATSVTASIAGVTAAILAAPATAGVSIPLAIVGNSITAASITSSAAAFGHGQIFNKDIVKQVENLKCIIDSLAKKDEEINLLIKNNGLDLDTNEESKIYSAIEAGDKLNKNLCPFTDQDITDQDKAKKTAKVAWSIISPVTYSILNSDNFQSEQDFEEALLNTADKIDKNTNVLMKIGESKFKYMNCIPSEKHLSRGRISYVDGGGGCTRTMKVQYYDPHQKNEESLCEMESDSKKVIRLPEGASKIKISFFVGGRSVMKINRSDPKQPWIKCSDKNKEIDVFEIDQGDGIDIVFYLKGSFTNSYVHKAWDFGRHPSTKPNEWEWWPENKLEEDRIKLLPDSNTRNLNRTIVEMDDSDEPCGLGLSCCLCCRQDNSDVVVNNDKDYNKFANKKGNLSRIDEEDKEEKKQ